MVVFTNSLAARLARFEVVCARDLTADFAGLRIYFTDFVAACVARLSIQQTEVLVADCARFGMGRTREASTSSTFREVFVSGGLPTVTARGSIVWAE